MRHRPFVLLPLIALLSSPAWAQSSGTPVAAPAPAPDASAGKPAPAANLTPAPNDPAARAKAEAAAVRARAAAALKARDEADAAAKTGTGGAAGPIAPTQLVYGDYACTLNTWNVAERRMVFTPKGTVKLNSNGTYNYLDGGYIGRYAYNANTRQITWLTGHFAEAGQPKTTFTPGDKVAQVDIVFETKSGPVNWSCGCNNK